MITPSQRRQQLLDEMTRLDRLQCGYLSKQYLKQRRDGRTVHFGPYYVLQHIRNGRKRSRRVGIGEVQVVETDLAAWKRFQAFAQELAQVTEQLTLDERAEQESKKNARPSRGRGLRRRSGF